MNRQLRRTTASISGASTRSVYLPFAGLAFKKCYYDIQKRIASLALHSTSRLHRSLRRREPVQRFALHASLLHDGEPISAAIADDEFIQPATCGSSPTCRSRGWRIPASWQTRQTSAPRFVTTTTRVRAVRDAHRLQLLRKATRSVRGHHRAWLKVDSGFVDAIGLKDNGLRVPIHHHVRPRVGRV